MCFNIEQSNLLLTKVKRVLPEIWWHHSE